MNRIDSIPAAVVILIAVVLAGCILTGTVVITARLAPDADGDPVTITDQNFTGAEMEVNLTDNATFKDYRDDIRNIENIGFYLSATNNSANDAVLQLFLEPDTAVNYSSVEMMIDSLADLILTDLPVPGNQTVTIDGNESMNYVTNLDYFKDVLEGGVFSIYPAALNRDDFSITIDSLVVIVTLTGKK